jgi:ABC-type antimicrobial peptide transport system permease subunit
VVLVTCANLAGLSLAKGAARRHEFSMRAAIGAGRWLLFRQSLVESALLSLLGGGAGILLAFWGKTVVSKFLAGSAEGLA